MSEGSAEGGVAAPLSDPQFSAVTTTADNPQTAQNPGNGIWAMGFYPRPTEHPRRHRKKRKRTR